PRRRPLDGRRQQHGKRRLEAEAQEALGAVPAHFALGRNVLTTASFVVRYGPSIRSMQYGIAGKTASRQSRMALGLPGRLTISDLPRMPAICRDRMAVGTTFSETARICSPKPSSSLSQTASVASGVTSRRAGPVPPVVTLRQRPSKAH